MASNDWLEIYRSFTPDQLVAEKTRLLELITAREGITSIGYGTKQWQFSIDELRNKLQSVVRIQNERSASRPASSGVIDYSRVRV